MTSISGRERTDGSHDTWIARLDYCPAWVHRLHDLHHRIQHRQIPEIKDLDPMSVLGV